MRGLKHLCLDREHHRHKVASFTDAWIETLNIEGTSARQTSHLLQMRGLKLFSDSLYFCSSTSHLLQMRGLKLSKTYSEEIPICRIFYRCVDWNPFSSHLSKSHRSHLLQMRGLKLKEDMKVKCCLVASFTDAWIETTKYAKEPWRKTSRIFYRCVDWNLAARALFVVNVSRIFYRCVDWNHNSTSSQSISFVASFTDAWIETQAGLATCFGNSVASFTDAWIETPASGQGRLCRTVASFTDAWIETDRDERGHETVDVASFTDAWIETQGREANRRPPEVASFTDAWIETML